MVMNGYDTDGDGANNFHRNAELTTPAPITVSRSSPVRLYLANLTEFDLINSFHLHADFFRYQPNGTGERWEYTDLVMQCQGQRGVIEIEFANTGTFMFHAHQSEFTELGWMGSSRSPLMDADAPSGASAAGDSGRSARSSPGARGRRVRPRGSRSSTWSARTLRPRTSSTSAASSSHRARSGSGSRTRSGTI
jgi:hypothetical protein